MVGKWKKNELMIAKCYEKVGQRNDMLEWLNKANLVAVSTPEVSKWNYSISCCFDIPIIQRLTILYCT